MNRWGSWPALIAERTAFSPSWVISATSATVSQGRSRGVGNSVTIAATARVGIPHGLFAGWIGVGDEPSSEVDVAATLADETPDEFAYSRAADVQVLVDDDFVRRASEHRDRYV